MNTDHIKQHRASSPSDTASIDAQTRRLLRVLGESALRLADGQALDDTQLAHYLSQLELTDRHEELLTVPEACNQLRISRWSFYRLIHQRSLATVTIGRRRFVARAEIDRFVLTLRHAGEAP
ncbi:helix-turn-helix domain-containing protein [Mycolicibacterium wolinskyi]|uniref:Helix-turn-helix domain-containing protein n=1 Tax=Mycolicibacterium wolinskyi TaxID=59750 RepID=A0A1X2F803_9MYCO|nr:MULTISPECIES: helix-turn-helix domain-containing protein [Mycolicibacterium]MCV7286736.1 helix-turn-helix domain-containing protein [Mycolicibacterium wolinskyi]MCV7293716.1 helix-turn-helix domain-containing protein [Mycolicibacterium goodii]ORX14571.1 hypothetical protein AWC31_25640 [Mycolicibacterium wolinskyi]